MDIVELSRQSEHKLAPEPLIAVQALANTFDLEGREERLSDPDAARRWLIESDLATPGIEVGSPELAELLELRAVIRALLDANLSGERPRAQEAELARIAAAHPVGLAVDEAGELALDLTPASSVAAVIAQLVGIVFDAQLRSQWERLKICACDECRWAFYDASRNRGGTWCQMEVCGNRVKNRAYRRRRSGTEAGRR